MLRKYWSAPRARLTESDMNAITAARTMFIEHADSLRDRKPPR